MHSDGNVTSSIPGDEDAGAWVGRGRMNAPDATPHRSCLLPSRRIRWTAHPALPTSRELCAIARPPLLAPSVLTGGWNRIVHLSAPALRVIFPLSLSLSSASDSTAIKTSLVSSINPERMTLAQHGDAGATGKVDRDDATGDNAVSDGDGGATGLDDGGDQTGSGGEASGVEVETRGASSSLVEAEGTIDDAVNAAIGEAAVDAAIAAAHAKEELEEANEAVMEAEAAAETTKEDADVAGEKEGETEPEGNVSEPEEEAPTDEQHAAAEEAEEVDEVEKTVDGVILDIKNEDAEGLEVEEQGASGVIKEEDPKGESEDGEEGDVGDGVELDVKDSVDAAAEENLDPSERLPTDPTNTCGIPVFTPLLKACLAGPSPQCCAGLDEKLAPESGVPTANCLCVYTVLQDVNETAAPVGFDIYRTLEACAAEHGMKTGWYGQENSQCPEVRPGITRALLLIATFLVSPNGAAVVEGDALTRMCSHRTLADH